MINKVFYTLTVSFLSEPEKDYIFVVTTTVLRIEQIDLLLFVVTQQGFGYFEVQEKLA